jgi:hypothetical protein
VKNQGNNARALLVIKQIGGAIHVAALEVVVVVVVAVVVVVVVELVVVVYDGCGGGGKDDADVQNYCPRLLGLGISGPRLLVRYLVLPSLGIMSRIIGACPSDAPGCRCCCCRCCFPPRDHESSATAVEAATTTRYKGKITRNAPNINEGQEQGAPLRPYYCYCRSLRIRQSRDRLF